MLRGVRLNYAMEAQLISLGRWPAEPQASKQRVADCNLGVELYCPKVSRLQAIVFLRHDGFHLRNLAKTLVFVNGRHVAQGEQRALPHNACVEIANVAFVFETNRRLVGSLFSH